MSQPFFFLQNDEVGILVLLIIFLSVGFVSTMVTQMLAQIHFSPLHGIENRTNPATMAAETTKTQQPTGFGPNMMYSLKVHGAPDTHNSLFVAALHSIT